MKNLFWKGVAKLLRSCDWVRQKIIDNAIKHPMEVQLYGYMSRWWVIKRRSWLPFHIRMHLIHRRDMSPDLHNHPGAFRTFILHGWYIEEREDSMFYTRNVGDTALMPAGGFHNIVEVSPWGCLTIVIGYGWAKSRGNWGFKLESGEVVPHEHYHQKR